MKARHKGVARAALWVGLSFVGATALALGQMAQLPHAPIITSASGWTLQLPPGPVVPPVVITGFGSAWSFPLGQSKWIGPNAQAGLYPTPPGNYTYKYRLCYVMRRAGIQPVQPVLHLDVMSDDHFDAYLDGASSPFLSSSNTGGSHQVSNGSVTLNTSGAATLRIVVNNVVGPTGLDVNGWVTALLTPCPNLSRPLAEAPPADRKPL